MNIYESISDINSLLETGDATSLAKEKNTDSSCNLTRPQSMITRLKQFNPSFTNSNEYIEMMSSPESNDSGIHSDERLNLNLHSSNHKPEFECLYSTVIKSKVNKNGIIKPDMKSTNLVGLHLKIIFGFNRLN
jgi:hypothetical protein